MDRLETFLTSPDIAQPERELAELEIFHETTKLYPSSVPKLNERTMFYLTNQEAFREMARNGKPYLRRAKLALPAPAPIVRPYAELLQGRRSPSSFKKTPVSMQQLSDLLAATARVNDSFPHPLEPSVILRRRPYPSAGGLYPVETYAILLNVEGQSPQVTHYDPSSHGLHLLGPTSVEKLATAIYPDSHLGTAAAVLVFTSCWGRSAVKYAQRAYRFAMLEAGMVSSMAAIAAIGSGIGALNWGGYFDDRVHDLLGIDGVNEAVVHMLLLGIPDEYLWPTSSNAAT